MRLCYKMADFESKLKKLTLEQKQKAFEEAEKYFISTKETPDEEGKLVLVTEEYYKKALDFIRTHFIVQEPVEKALGLSWNDEVEQFWMDIIRCNISLMLLANNGDIMAIRASKFLCYDEVSDDSAIKTRGLRLLEQFCHKGEAKADFFGHFGAKECIHFFGLGTNDKYKHHHLATRMLKTAKEMARHLGAEFIKGEGSNNFAKMVYEHDGFELLHEEFFDDFEIDGDKPIQNTGDNKSLRFYGLKISS